MKCANSSTVPTILVHFLDVLKSSGGCYSTRIKLLLCVCRVCRRIRRCVSTSVPRCCPRSNRSTPKSWTKRTTLRIPPNNTMLNCCTNACSKYLVIPIRSTYRSWRGCSNTHLMPAPPSLQRTQESTPYRYRASTNFVRNSGSNNSHPRRSL